MKRKLLSLLVLLLGVMGGVNAESINTIALGQELTLEQAIASEQGVVITDGTNVLTALNNGDPKMSFAPFANRAYGYFFKFESVMVDDVQTYKLMAYNADATKLLPDGRYSAYGNGGYFSPVSWNDTWVAPELKTNGRDYENGSCWRITPNANGDAYNFYSVGMGKWLNGATMSTSSKTDFHFYNLASVPVVDFTPYLPQLSASADKANRKYYRLKNAKYGFYAKYVSTSKEMGLVSNANEASLFYFVENGGNFNDDASKPKVKIYSYESGDNFIYSVNQWKTEDRNWFLNVVEINGLYGFQMTYKEKYPDALRVGGSGSTEVKYNGSTCAAYEGSVWNVEFVEVDPSAVLTTITWNLKENGNTIKTEVIANCIEGQSYTTSISAPSTTINGTTTVVASSENQTIDLTYTVNNDAPFQYSDDFEHATWYTLTIRGNQYPTYDEAQDKVITNGKVAPNPIKKADLFAFVGNPWSVKILNGAIGAENALGYSDRVVKMSLAEATAYVFENNGGHLVFASSSNAQSHLNDNSGTLKYWTDAASGTDGGSSFTFTPVDEDYVADLFAGNYTKTEADVTTFSMDKLNGDAWTFDTPVDLSDYKYMIVTTIQSSGNMNGSMILADNTGKRAGNNWNDDEDREVKYNKSEAGTRGAMWLDRWNNQNCACINLDYLKKQGLDVTNISSFSVPNGSNISAVYLTNYESGKAVSSKEEWGSCTGDYVRSYDLLEEGKYGMIALKYAAAVSGAKVYTVAGFEANVGLYLTPHYGTLEAGVPYIYEACDFEGHNADGGNKGSNSNVNFYRVDGNQISGDWSTDDTRDNGIVGVYDGGFGYGLGSIGGCYIVEEDGLAPKSHSSITSDAQLKEFTKNRGFFDPGKVKNNTTTAKILPVYESVNLKVSEGKYGTFVAPFEVTVPAGVTAYTAAYNAETKEVDLTEAGTPIAANTPVIVMGNADVSKDFYGAPAKAETVGTELVGILKEDVNVPAGSYVLQTQNEVQQFYKVAAEAKGKKNRCYLNIPAASVKVLNIVVDGEETAIMNLDADVNAGKAQIFDLSGRKVSKAQNGIYIVNGRKVVK